MTKLWMRRGDETDANNLVVVLCALINREGGEIIIDNGELMSIDGQGVRAKYIPGGHMKLWTYDVVDDMKKIAGIED